MKGGLSAGFAKTLVAPIERIKILLQVQDANKYIPAQERFDGMIDCFRRVKKH